MRKVRKVAVALVALVVLLVVVDFGAATVTEYRVSRAVRHDNGLDSDPEVTINAFPFLTSVPGGHANSVSVQAHDVPTPVTGRTTVDAHFSGVDFPDRSPLTDPHTTITADEATVQWIIGQTSLGQVLGVPDLELSIPQDDDSDTGTGAEAGTLEYGPPISTDRVLLTGRAQTSTDESGPVRETVTVIAFLVLGDNTVSIVPKAVQPKPVAPGIDPDPVPPIEVVGPQFAATIGIHGLPYGVSPTSVHADGTDIVIEGRAEDVRVALTDLVSPRPPAAPEAGR
ncbi:MAG: LmeA family phospholipid-binding protein [Tomitella sp.]|nr:LmeA family phospholipid-binding protein [Tomitella sp.]